MPSAVVLNISIIAATQTQIWHFCAFYCPSPQSFSSYLSGWSNSHTGIYTFETPYMSFILILIIFQRSQQPKPFGVPDLFFQPLDNSNWTMLDIRWDSLKIQGHVFLLHWCKNCLLRKTELSNKRELAGIGDALRWHFNSIYTKG